ncbi:MAG: hypothetical protein ACHP7J_00130 [Terriglobales bacterium]
MLPPATIKSFNDDFELARRSYATASVYLQFEDQLQEAADGLKRTWLAAMECGAALKRIRDSKSYQENFLNWKDVYEDLHISRQHAERLMACSVILSELPKELIGRIDMPLSFRQMEVLGEASDEQRAEVLEKVAAEPSAAHDEFSKLREALRGTAQASKASKNAPKVIEAIAEPQKKERGVEWARKQAQGLLSWFIDRNDYEGKAHMEVLVKRLAVLQD